MRGPVFEKKKFCVSKVPKHAEIPGKSVLKLWRAGALIETHPFSFFFHAYFWNAFAKNFEHYGTLL
jgi:hypothetical protein